MKKILNRVTLTGADDSVEVGALRDLSEKYPFVEWGILISKNSRGKPRFPSTEWMEKLALAESHHATLLLSGHLCGKWVRDVCKCDWGFLADRELSDIWSMFTRFQLNFSPYVKKIDTSLFMESLRRRGPARVQQYIFQLKNLNAHFVEIAARNGVSASTLFDQSGGRGVLPGEWPEVPKTGVYCGYSGGLGPDNLQAQLSAISAVCGPGPIWIDAETQVRSDDDEQFDLKKVEDFLKIAQEWLTLEAS